MTDKNIEIKGVKLRSTIIPGKTPSPFSEGVNITPVDMGEEFKAVQSVSRQHRIAPDCKVEELYAGKELDFKPVDSEIVQQTAESVARMCGFPPPPRFVTPEEFVQQYDLVSGEWESGQKPKGSMYDKTPFWKTPKHPAMMTAEELVRWQKRRSRLPARVRARDSWLDGPLRNLTMKNEYRFTQNDLHQEKRYFPVRTFNRGWTFNILDVDKDNPCIGYINMTGFPKWIDLVAETCSDIKLWRDVKLLGVDKVVNTGKGVNYSDDLDLKLVPVEFSEPVFRYEGILCTAKTYTLEALPYELDGSYNAFVDFQRRIARKQRYMERHPATPNHDYGHPGIWVRYNGAQLNCLYDILVWGDLLYRDCYLSPEGWKDSTGKTIVKQWPKEEIFAVRVAVGVDGKHKPIPDTVTDAVYQDIPAIAVWGEHTQAFFPIKG